MVAAFREVMATEERELDRDRKIVEQFKQGVRKICAMQIWEELKALTKAPTPQALADRFDLTLHIAWRGLNEGDLRLENLIVMLSELGLEFASLQAMPPIDKRAIAGYRESMTWLRRSGAAFQSEEKPYSPSITVREFGLLWNLYRHGEFWRAEALTKAKPGDRTAAEKLEAAIVHVWQRAQQALGEPMAEATLEEIQRLRQVWGETFWDCYVAVTYQWLGDSRGAKEAYTV